nr:EpsG family protein [Muriicola soli]
MRTYARHFEHYELGGSLLTDKDIVFHSFMKLSAKILTIHQFFLLCCAIYIYPMYRISKVYFKNYWFYSFLLLIVSLSFWTYGVNGIRNGMATSFFLWAMTYRDKSLPQILFLTAAVLFHQTLLLPVGAFFIAKYFTNVKVFSVFWLSAIPLSIALGGFWESLFISVGFADPRLESYLSGSVNNSFRFDFLIYSAAAILLGWYFIFIRKFKDKTFNSLFITYLICNAFWILVIRASFSNRFAYLSWFLMAVIIIYPILKDKTLIRKRKLFLNSAVLFYFLFTYFMYAVYYAEPEL